MDKKEFLDLQKKYDQLELKYNELENEHNLLKHETSENVIIESMNEMKKRYDVMIRNTVSMHKHETLIEKYKDLKKTLIGVEMMIKRILQILRKINIDSDGHIFKIEVELNILKEILEEIEIN